MSFHKFFEGIILAYLLHSISAQSISADDKLTRQLSTGSLLKGAQTLSTRGDPVYLYLGIPYAEAPINENRYKPPIMKGKWNGVLDASKYRVSCLYDSAAAEEITTNDYMSEDCLLINVITSKYCVDNGGCSVAVFFVGGDYNYGSPIIIPAEKLADRWASDDIVVVTMNNRLGSFGFLNTKNKTSAVKNAGLLDQIEALKWVQDEIKTFGGDNGKVTLIGKGAGAINVDHLAISPATNGYFDKIALIGGAAGITPYINAGIYTNAKATLKLVTETGCDSKNSQISNDAEDILNCLRSKDASDLLSLQRKLEDKSPMYSFKSPTLDGNEDKPILPDPIKQLVESRKGVTMMIGSLPNSSGLTKITNQLSTTKSLEAWCQIALKYRRLNNTNQLVNECAKEYSQKSRRSDLIVDVAVYLPILESAYSNAKNNGKTFLFDYNTNADDQDFIFDTLEQRNSVDYEMTPTTYLHVAIINFIKNGDPSIETIKWDEFNTDNMNYLAISDTSMPRNVRGYHKEAVNFWNRTAHKLSYDDTKTDDYESTTMWKPESDSDYPQKLPNGTWSISELRSAVDALIENAVTQVRKYAYVARNLNRWNQEMADILKRLQYALKNLEEAVNAEIMRKKKEYGDYKERKTTLNYQQRSTTKGPTTSKPSKSFPWEKGTGRTKNWSDSATELPEIVLRGKSDDDTTSLEVKIPANAYDHLEEVIKIIDEFFDKLMQDNTNHKDVSTYPNDRGEEKMADAQNLVKRAIAGSMFPVIIPSGNSSGMAYPTVAAVTVTSHWYNSAWFWVIHIIAVILIIALIVYTCTLHKRLRRRHQYETVH